MVGRFIAAVAWIVGMRVIPSPNFVEPLRALCHYLAGSGRPRRIVDARCVRTAHLTVGRVLGWLVTQDRLWNLAQEIEIGYGEYPGEGIWAKGPLAMTVGGFTAIPVVYHEGVVTYRITDRYDWHRVGGNWGNIPLRIGALEFILPDWIFRCAKALGAREYLSVLEIQIDCSSLVEQFPRFGLKEGSIVSYPMDPVFR